MPNYENPANKLMVFANSVRDLIFRSPTLTTRIEIPAGKGEICLPIDDPKVKEWLEAKFKSEEGRHLTPDEYGKLLNNLKNPHETETYDEYVGLRTAKCGDEYFIDPAWGGRWVIAFSKGDWSIKKSADVKFENPPGMLELPEPKRGGDHQLLWQFVHLVPEENRLMFLNWMLCSMIKAEVYQIAVLRGQQGSGKSTSLRVAKALIDPHDPYKNDTRKIENNIWKHAQSHWLLFYDNISKVSDGLSDQFCLMSEGKGTACLMNEDDGIANFTDAKRPIAIASIVNVLTRGDVLDRSIILETNQITKEKRQDPEELLHKFSDKAGEILGGLYDLLAQVLAVRYEIRSKVWPRMAGVARMGMALERILGLPNGAYLEAYDSNHQAGAIVSVEASPILLGLQKLVSKRGMWQGPATPLLKALNEIVLQKNRAPNWPKHANQLSGELHRLETNSGAGKLRISKKRTGGLVTWKIEAL